MCRVLHLVRILFLCANVVLGKRMARTEVDHFASPTDAMIEKYAAENPKAASDYDEVMGELFKEYQEAEKKLKERDQLIESSTDKEQVAKAQAEYLSEYDDDDAFAMGNWKNDYVPPEDLLEKDEKLKQMKQQEQPVRDEVQRRPQPKEETPAEMEKRIRQEIHQQLLEEYQERRASKNWRQNTPSSLSKPFEDVCLPSPLQMICGLNIMFSFMWIITLAFSITAFLKTTASSSSTSPKKPKKKKTMKLQ